MDESLTVKNFTNIDEEDFEGMYGGKTIALRRGQTKAFPIRVAKHLAGQLIHKILTRQKKDYLLDPEREALMDRILGEVEAPEPEPLPAQTPAPIPEEKEEEEFPEIPKEEKKEVKKKRGRPKKKK